MKKLSIIAICISIASFLLSFYLIFSENRFDTDWGQIITGVLSFFVTILIVWQIYGVISIDEKISLKMTELQKNIDKEIVFKSDRAIHIALANIGNTMKEEGSVLTAFDMYMKAAMTSSKNGENESTEHYVSAMIEIFEALATHEKLDRYRRLFKKSRKVETYVNCLRMIDDQRISDLIVRITVVYNEI